MSPQRVQTLRTSVKNTRPASGSREPGELYVSFPDRQIGVIDASKNPKDLIAVRFFSPTTNYSVGDFVIEAGVGYRAKEAIVAGAFNAAQWDTINVSGSAEPPISPGNASQYWRGDKTWQTLDKTAVGLSSVDNTSDANKPVSGPQQTALNLKANLASPTFSGDPKAPTPAAGDNDTSIATTQFVARDFAPIMSPTFGGDPRAPTPATADNDTSIATTAYVKANLAGFAPLDSPVFIGNPTAPTPSPGDNDTSLATTAFVGTAIGNRPLDAPSDGQAYGRKDGGWADVTEEAPADGVSYGRKNGVWVASVGGAVIADSPPPGPLVPGQLWWDSDSGNTYLWYADADSQQWVQQNVQPGADGTLPTGIASTSADLSFGFRVAGTPAGSVNRWVWNDKPDLSGNDVMVLRETGILELFPSGATGIYGRSQSSDLAAHSFNIGALGPGTPDVPVPGAQMGFRGYDWSGGNPGGMDFYGAAADGTLTMLGYWTRHGLFSAAQYKSASANLVMGTNSAGGIYLRPNGVASTTGR